MKKIGLILAGLVLVFLVSAGIAGANCTGHYKCSSSPDCLPYNTYGCTNEDATSCWGDCGAFMYDCGETCAKTDCTPNCSGNTCGGDSCGGMCDCDPGYDCSGGVCVSTSEPQPTPQPTSTPVPLTCANLNLANSTVTPNPVNPGASVTASCDFGVVIDCVSPGGALTGCTWIGNVGSIARFNCLAPVTPNTYNHVCRTFVTPSCPTPISCNSGTYTVCSILPAPTNVTVTSQCQQNLVSWSAVSGATSYTIEKSADGVMWFANYAQSNTTSFTDSGGECGVGAYYRVQAKSAACPGSSSPFSPGVGPRAPQCPPIGPGLITCQDTGGDVTLTWPNATDGQKFDIYRGGVLVGSVAKDAKSYTSTVCSVPASYIVRAVDTTKSLVPAPGCQSTSGNQNCWACVPADSWWAASGGGNLVAATGRIQSKLPPSTYLMHNAEGDFPGIAIANSWVGSAVTSLNVNSQHWWYTIAPPGWGDSGNRFLSERENLYMGMWDRIKPRVEPLNASPVTISVNATSFGNLISLSAGHMLSVDANQVAVMHWTGDLTIGSLNVGANKVLLLVDGSVSINGSITWTDSLGGFVAILAQGNIVIDPVVGQAGSANVVDIRPPTVPADLKGIYYAQGTVSTGTVGGGVDDKLLKVEGTVVGMGRVSLQRVNKGGNPVEFFQFRPDLSEFLGRIGLRRRVINQLLNP